MTKKQRLIALFGIMAVVVVVLVMAPMALATTTMPFLTVHASDQPYVVSQTTYVRVLTIEPGGWIAAPDKHEVTMTVNGVEMGGVLVTTDGTDTHLSKPGTYRGNIVLTVTDENIVDYAPGGPPGTPHWLFPFRQALYLDESGVVDAKSALAALIGKKPVTPLIKNVSITSKGENFDGIYVAGGDYTIKNAKINLTGNGRSDFCGYGAAIVGTGESTHLVLDGVDVVNKGVARAGVVADGGANIIVKNSHIETRNGVLPADYIPTIDTAQMRSVPWMLSLSGNVRATNLLGTHTKSSYINSYISSEGWGVLSTDGCTEPTLTAINSTVKITGIDGYGSYGIGDATENFLGCNFDVATYATISRGSFLHYGDSDPAAVAQLNSSLGLGLTAKELAKIPDKPTVVDSDRFGIMWHGGGTLLVDGGTIFNTKEATFLDKGQTIDITVDGSDGAQLNPANGILMQVMDDDDPGPDMQNGGRTDTQVYHEPAFPPDKIGTWDLTSTKDAAAATFSDIALEGDFFNSITSVAPPMGPPPSPAAADEPAGPPAAAATGKNMVLTFNDSTLTGVITASAAHHSQTDIGMADYRLLGEVTNTAHEAINNGVIVMLNGSHWVVDGTCYLTKLVIHGGSSVQAPAGYKLAVTVDGAPVTLTAGGTYAGNIVIQLVALP